MRLWILVSMVAACNSGGRSRGTTTGGTDGGSGGHCTEGTHQCDGRFWQLCHNGVYTTDKTCNVDQVCSPSAGCTSCLPGGSGCDGDNIVTCDENGNPVPPVIHNCADDQLTCAPDPTTGQASCVTPCDPSALAHSYTGCVFYAVDLPQWTLPLALFSTVAADQQFAVAVANPWQLPLNVVVERDDAPPGMPAQLTQVTTQQVPARSLSTIPLPQREVSGYVQGGQRNRSLLTAAAYRITTDRPASVYQFNPINNPNAFSNDASLLIPANALDESYVVLGWPGRGGDYSVAGITVQADNRSYLTIVATRDNTKLRVTPSTEVMAGDNVPALPKGMPYTLTLNAFETLNLEGADYNTYGDTDFTGTRIEADGPIAVWSGVECVNVNPPNSTGDGCCCDHLEEQLFPRSSLGQDYVVARSEGRSHSSPDPEFFRVMGLIDATNVTTSLPAPDNQFTLQAGEMHQIITTEDFVVQADKAVMIGQFQVSQDSSVATNGDPSYDLVPPVAQHRNQYIFLVPSGYGENWMLMAIPSGGALTLDGQTVSGCSRAPAGTIGATSYEAVRCPVPEGAHTVASTQSFGLVVEGWGPGPVSYAYTGGMEFQSVNHQCSSDGDCPTEEVCFGGACAPPITVQ